MRVIPLRFAPPELDSITHDRKSGFLTIRLKIGDSLGLHLQSILAGLSDLARQLQREEERATRHERTDVLMERHKARHVAIARLYHSYRQAGIPHRKAISSLFTDPQFSDLNWKPADFNWCVKTYGALTDRGAK